MPTYAHPGVYIEEIPSGSRPIEVAGTSTAAFVGYTVKGPMAEPTLITRYDQYQTRYGGIRPLATPTEGGVTPVGDPMGLSLQAFFQNGGGRAYVVRLATGTATASGTLSDGDTPVLTFAAIDPGTWGDALRVRFAPKATALGNELFVVEVGVLREGEFQGLERFADVGLDEADPRFVEGRINDASELVTVAMAEVSELENLEASLTTAGTQTIALAGGDDGFVPGTQDYSAAFTSLLRVPDLNILCLPGQQWPAPGGGGNAVVDAAIAHCQTMKNRMLIIDPPPAAELASEQAITDLGLPTKTYSALYYPWVRVSNPYYHPETNPGAPRTLLAPPCAFAAGIWAKTDQRRGVWKAPAGVETALLGVAGLEFVVEDAEQDFLNPLGVNALRRLPNLGAVVWGARTLATRADPEWRYVPVRRTAMLIEESIRDGIQWAVFEPNDHRLWSSLRANIDSFMNGLFRAGAFQGERSSDAYFVRCGLGDTMTQGDIDRGQVIAIVGFAPLKPAEFVIVRIQQKVGQE